MVYFEGFLIGLRGGFEKHCTRASSFTHSGRSDMNQCRGSSLEDVDARESVFS